MLRNRWAKRLLLVVAIGLLFIIGYTCYQAMGYHQAGMGSPESTVRGALAAYETEEVSNVIAYFTPIYGSQMKGNLQRLFNACESIQIENIDTMIIYKEGLAARVQVSWDMLTTVSGQVSSQHFAKEIRLVQDDKKWKINQVI
jgi:predicted negative regulator of RcsB-dependent stress response